LVASPKNGISFEGITIFLEKISAKPQIPNFCEVSQVMGYTYVENFSAMHISTVSIVIEKDFLKLAKLRLMLLEFLATQHDASHCHLHQPNK
jgi:hypothetical protein